MPTYYNLSLYSDTDNIMNIYSVTDTLMSGYFSLFLVIVLGIWITYIRIQRNDSTIDALTISSFYALMLAIVLYAGNVFYTGIKSPGLYIFVPTIILITCSVIKFYNKY